MRQSKSQLIKDQQIEFCYTLFALSGSQPQLMQKWAHSLIDPSLKLPDLIDSSSTYAERIIQELSQIILLAEDAKQEGSIDFVSISDILTGTMFNMSINISKFSKESSDKLMALCEHMVGQCFSQNPRTKTNNQTHYRIFLCLVILIYRIVYLRALLNLLRSMAKLIDNALKLHQLNENTGTFGLNFIQSFCASANRLLAVLSLKFEPNVQPDMIPRQIFQQQEEEEHHEDQPLSSQGAYANGESPDRRQLINEDETLAKSQLKSERLNIGQEASAMEMQYSAFQQILAQMQSSVIFDLQRVTQVLSTFQTEILDHASSFLSENQPNLVGLDAMATGRVSRGHGLDIARYVTVEMVKSIIEQSQRQTEPLIINTILANAEDPLLFQNTPQYESWLSGFVWQSQQRVVINHLIDIYDSDVLTQLFPSPTSDNPASYSKQLLKCIKEDY